MEKICGYSLDIVKENIIKMKQLFPEVFSDGKIDLHKLGAILGENLIPSNERFEFSWYGKNKSLKLSQQPSTGTLRPDRASSKNWDKTNNLYIEGDNLEVLKLLQKSYFGKVKMIYIDPPYNTGKDFVYSDNFHDNIRNYQELTQQTTKANKEASGRYHTNWLNMMYPRLRIARNFLREDGIIFISIDDNELAHIKKLMDEIFGEENFIANMIIEGTPKNDPYIVSTVHEYCLVYVKNITEAKRAVWGVKNPLTVQLYHLIENVNSFDEAEERLFNFYKRMASQKIILPIINM